MAIITISRQLGCFGTDVAKELAERIGDPFLDKDGIGKALTDLGLSREKFEKYDERKPSFWDNFSSDREKFLNFMRTIVYDFAVDGKGIVIGRGGQFLLEGLPGMVRLRFIAPFEVRVARIMESSGCDERNAEMIIRQSDRDRSGFHRFFYDIDWDLPCYYDLVINTALFTIEKSTDVVEAILDAMDSETEQKAAAVRIEELRLGQSIVNKVLYEKQIHVSLFNAEIRGTEVTLKGSVTASADIAKVEDVVKGIPRLDSIRNELVFMDNYTPIY